MKKIIVLGFSATLLLQLLFSCKINLKNFETECYEIKKEGFVTVTIKNRKIIKKAITAQKQAIYSILYIGTSGESCYGHKALLKSEKEFKKFKKIEKEFFSKKGDWPKFCSNYIEEGMNVFTKKNPLYVTVAYNELRIYLENKKIIKTLNHGF